MQICLRKNVQTIPLLEEVRVEMADMKVERRPIMLVTSVGSCVAICIYDSVNRCGGLAHIMLPNAGTDCKSIPSKYAESAVPTLVGAIKKLAGGGSCLLAKIAGGADMFSGLKCGMLRIGEKNVQASRQALQTEGIRIVAEDVGGTSGRRVSFNVVDGSVIVYGINRVEKTL
jgi:chemotaxis protein CheD